jgi:hypothetical protein
VAAREERTRPHLPGEETNLFLQNYPLLSYQVASSNPELLMGNEQVAHRYVIKIPKLYRGLSFRAIQGMMM